MRVAALYDVHGNLPALEAVLAEVSAAKVDAIVCGGDVAAGPFPRECVERLHERGAVFVRGNADRDLSEWLQRELPVDAQVFLAEQPHSRVLGDVLYCHGSPRRDDEILTKVSPPERLAEALEGVEQALVVFGHTHVQFEARVGDVGLANAGSVGAPYEGKQGAFWALVAGAEVELRRTPYAYEAAVVAIRATAYPDVDQFVTWLLEPADPDETSRYFESIA